MNEPTAPADGEGFRRHREGLSAKHKAIAAGAGLVVVVLAWLFATRILPRWWAQRAGDLADGKTSMGAFTGLVIGFLFTVVPLFVARFALRRGRAWKRRALIVAAALVLAAPNLTTLGIVVGTGSGAHAGERTLDVEAPGFRAGTLIGAVLAAVAFGAIVYGMLKPSRRRKPDADVRPIADPTP